MTGPFGCTKLSSSKSWLVGPKASVGGSQLDQILAVVKVIEQEAAKRTELPGAESALATAGGPDAA